MYSKFVHIHLTNIQCSVSVHLPKQVAVVPAALKKHKEDKEEI